jgi:hypothetical protein
MAKLRHDSFERFYYERIGLGEGCGCAEHVTRIRDLDALAARLTSAKTKPGALPAAIAWLRNIASLIARRMQRDSSANPAKVPPILHP